MNIIEHNRQAWDRESSSDGGWSIPVSEETIDAARDGKWNVNLSPLRSVPESWFGELQGKDVLCLAAGGGQQAPVLAAAGARVVSFDLSEVQLEKDRRVAERHNLSLRCVQGDMADLSAFPAECFDLVFHPVSNLFVPDVELVWKECHRVLKPNGNLLAGFMNPGFFLFDHAEAERVGKIEVRYKLPYSEPDSLDEDERQELEESKRALEFSHTLETQIGGQIKAGLFITGFYEDYWTDDIPFNAFSPSYIVTQAVKFASGTGT